MNNSIMIGKYLKIFFITLLIIPQCIIAQTTHLKGTVKDASNKSPLIGVTIQVKNSKIGVITDYEGVYSIDVPQGSILKFSYIGYESQEIPVKGTKDINVLLKEITTGLDEVVVIGYGKTTKKEITGSVTSLKENDLNIGSFTNAGGLLQGKVAGLSVTNPSGGDPNAKYEILLRGTNTLKAGQGPLIIIDGVVNSDLRNINFQEVESIDVLKDGSAAAIYGTRGTNGVIIITTKHAKAGVTQVEYSGQVNVQAVTRRAKPMTAKEFEWTINNFVPSNANSLYGANTDWFDEITRTPISQKHSLAVSGGTEIFSHRTIIDIEQNEGIQLHNNSNKYLFKTNIRQKALEGWLDLDYNAYASKRSYSSANYDAFRQAFMHNPTEPIYDESNKQSGGYYRIIGMDYFNPVAMIHEENSKTNVDDIGINVRATLNIIPVSGLKWDNFVSYGQQTYESRDYKTSFYPSIIGEDGQASINHEFSQDMQWESTLSYITQFGKNSIQAILGYTYQENKNQSSGMSNSGFDTDNFLTNNIGSGSFLAKGLASMSSYKESNKYIAFFGRLMYNYDEKYMVSVSLRKDGSSRFGKDNKWGTFPAVSLGWRLNRENFLKDTDWINELKIRAGYGVTGNQDFSNYKSLLLMRAKGYYFYNGKWINTYEPKSNSNPNLAWEKKSEWNVGIDFSVLKNRISGTVDYYSRLTTNLLYDYNVPVPPYDYKVLFTNVGSITNKGIEATLSLQPIIEKNFKWSSMITFSKNTNKLKKFTNEEFKDGEYKIGWLNTPVGVNCQRLIEGQSLGTFYGPIWDGVDESGRDKLKNSIAGSVAESKWSNLGTAYPDFILGWNNTFIYKNWDLNISLRASIGGKVFNRYAAEFENLTPIGLRNILSSWLDDTKFTGNVTYSSKYLEDATYLKLDNVSLGYNIPIQSKFIKKFRLNLTGQNLVCITSYKGVDPEVGLSGLTPGIESTSYYPRTAIITFGVNLTF